MSINRFVIKPMTDIKGFRVTERRCMRCGKRFRVWEYSNQNHCSSYCAGGRNG